MSDLVGNPYYCFSHKEAYSKAQVSSSTRLESSIGSQALEVMAINHKNNASNKCLRSNTTVLLCYVDTIVLGHILMIYGNNFKRL